MKKQARHMLVVFVTTVVFISMLVTQIYADDTVTPVTGISVAASSATSGPTLSGGTVTITRKGGLFNSSKCNITITNDSDKKANISFSYAHSGYGSATLKGESISSGTYSGTLDARGTVSMTLLGAGGYQTGTLTLSNFSWKEVSDDAAATVTYDSTKGSVNLGGSAVSSGGSATATDGTLAAVATPASGCSFLGWINTDTDELLSTASSDTLNVPQNMNIQAVFVNKTSDTAWFIVDNKYMTSDLNKASKELGSKIVLANNGTLAAGNYTINSGDTLLIPYDDANTLCTTAPACDADSYKKPSVYRTLTMANGANITVNGAISLSAAQSSKYGYNGMPSGPLPFIKMDSGSNITVKKGGALYAWGYITGSGSVSVESGGAVYECFQIADYRGGDVTSTMTSNTDTHGVFPFNQYYLQNIEVPMTLYAGAKETGYTSVQVTLAGAQHSDVPFIGTSDSMFVISNGYVVKDYVEGKGRTNIEIHGDISVSTITMSLKVSLLGTITINSSKYALPIPHHFTVSVESGNISLDQSMAFLPGSELTIKQGASCTLGSGKKIYVYDLDQWLYNSGANGYSGTSNKPYVQLRYVPGGDGTTGRLKDAQIQIDGTVDASAGSVYVTAGGAKIFSTGTGVVKVASTTDSVAYQVITDNTDISSWPEIAMQPAILQDADGTDVATKEKAGTYTYYASTGKWCTPTHRYESTVTDPTCTEKGYTTYTCIDCGRSYTDSETAALGHTEVTDAAVAATCTETGLTAGKHCSVCNEVLVAQKEIPALGHSYKSATTEPTCTDVGYTTYTCTVCGDSYISDIKAPTGHSWDENGKCSCGAVEANLITIAGANIKAGDSLDMYFYVSTEKVESSDYAVVTKTFADGRPNVTETIPFSEWKAYNSSLTRFGFSDISAKEMTDKIYVTIFDSNNIAKSDTWVDSVHDYAVRAIKAYNSNEKLLAALVDMLNYGAAAQTYFEYNDEAKNLANVDIGDYQKFATDEVEPENNRVEGKNYYGSTVTASNELILTFYFENISTDMTATVEYTDHNGGDPVQITILGEEFVERGNLYGVQVTGLSIADGYQLVTCEVKDGDTTVASATDSVESFIARSTDGNGDVFEMLMKFIYSAHTYFHS